MELYADVVSHRVGVLLKWGAIMSIDLGAALVMMEHGS